MTCDVRRDPMGRPTVISCSRNRRTKSSRCVSCGQQTAILACDAERPTKTSGTCDAALCERCTVHLAAFELDCCPTHAAEETPAGICVVAVWYAHARHTPPRHACRGAILHPHGFCLRHGQLFGRWLRDAGGWDGAYADPALSKDEKRARFGEWLDGQAEDAA